ncbi:MAG: alpha/beta hydrolase [Bacteroidales bacterium]
MKHILHLFILPLIIIFSTFSQKEIKLYPNGAKETNGIMVSEMYRDSTFLMNISESRIYAFLPEKVKSNGTAVLICPGGGYGGVSFIYEGSDIAKWFNSMGVSAFVLYYRMPNGHSKIPLSDAQTALEIIHKRANEWGINPEKIGIMGFSAGGHIASTVGTHFKTAEQRPAFMILGYPVISMKKEITHAGSRNNLVGENPSEEEVNFYSNELHVTRKTPPTFIVYAKDDKLVPVENSIRFYNALKANNIEVRLDTFAVGGHGFGMKKRGIPADNWSESLKVWLAKNVLENK